MLRCLFRGNAAEKGLHLAAKQDRKERAQKEEEEKKTEGGGGVRCQMSDACTPFPLPSIPLNARAMCLFLPSLISNQGGDRLKDTQIKQCSQTVTCDK